MYYYGARYYAPWLGRWTSCDPAGQVDGLNPYQYVRSNPVKLVDPTGRQAQYFAAREIQERAVSEWNELVEQPLNNAADSAGQIAKGVGRAVLGAVAGSFKLATGLLGASWGEEALDEAIEGVKNLPAAVTDTVQNWDKLSTEEKAYRVAGGVIMVYSAGKASAGIVRSAVGIGKGLTQAGGDLGEIRVPKVEPTDTAVQPPPTDPVTAPTDTTAKPPGSSIGGGTPVADPAAPPAPATAPAINEGAQGKHQIFHNNYQPGRGRSILLEDPHSLAQAAGSGKQVGTVPRGQAGFREQINFGKQIGYDRPQQQPRWAVPTDEGVVHYNKEGKIHIVPTRRGKGGF